MANDAAFALRDPCRHLVIRRNEPRHVRWEIWRVAVELMHLHQQVEAGRRVLHRLLTYVHKTNANGMFCRAFQYSVRASSTSDSKLRDIAQEVVARADARYDSESRPN